MNDPDTIIAGTVFAEKKLSAPRPADPVIIDVSSTVETTGEAAEEQSKLKLSAFADGFIFKFTGHPTEAGRFVLFDVGNNPIAITGSAPIADLLCQAVRALFQAAAAMQAAEASPQLPGADVVVMES